jgi:hypothetical protein
MSHIGGGRRIQCGRMAPDPSTKAAMVDGLGSAARACALPGRFFVRTLADVPVEPRAPGCGTGVGARGEKNEQATALRLASSRPEDKGEGHANSSPHPARRKRRARMRAQRVAGPRITSIDDFTR